MGLEINLILIWYVYSLYIYFVGELMVKDDWLLIGVLLDGGGVDGVDFE